MQSIARKTRNQIKKIKSMEIANKAKTTEHN